MPDDDSDPTKEIIINKHQWRKSSRNTAKSEDTRKTPKQKISGKASADSKPVLSPDMTIRQAAEQMTIEQMAEIVAQLQAEQERRKKEAAQKDDQIDGQMDIMQWMESMQDTAVEDTPETDTETEAAEPEKIPDDEQMINDVAEDSINDIAARLMAEVREELDARAGEEAPTMIAEEEYIDDEADDADNQHQQRVDAHHRRGVVHRGIVRFQQTVMFQQIVGLAFEPAGEHEQCDGRHDHIVGGGDGHQHSFRLASQWCRRLHGVALRIHIGPFRGVASSDVRCAARER